MEFPHGRGTPVMAFFYGRGTPVMALILWQAVAVQDLDFLSLSLSSLSLTHTRTHTHSLSLSFSLSLPLSLSLLYKLSLSYIRGVCRMSWGQAVAAQDLDFLSLRSCMRLTDQVLNLKGLFIIISKAY